MRPSVERTVDVVRLELRDARCTRRSKPRGCARKHVRTEVRARDRRCEPVDLHELLEQELDSVLHMPFVG